MSDRWEDLDAPNRMFGVFATEAYSADPVAIFSTEHDARNWLAWQDQIGDESTIGSCDYTVCAVERLIGRVWNSRDDVQSECDPAGAPPYCLEPQACIKSAGCYCETRSTLNRAAKRAQP
jgi:hypothetical protein